MRTFISRTTNDSDDYLASALIQREAEIASYEDNIANYTAQLASLNGLEWTDELRKFKGCPNAELPTRCDCREDCDLISKLNYRDRLAVLLFTEKSELQKVELAYSVILSRLPAGPRRDSALERVLAKMP